MLEILFLVGLCKVLGNRLREKGRKPFWMQVMLVVTWVLGEFAGGVFAGIWHVVNYGEEAPMGLGVYLLAILGAALGAGFTFLVAKMLPPVIPYLPPAEGDENPLARNMDPNNPYAP